jgi:hypothetical protein
MKAAIAKTEEHRLNKFVWANIGQPENPENTAIKIENPFGSRDRYDKNRTEGLIGAKNSHSMQEKAFHLGNVGLLLILMSS